MRFILLTLALFFALSTSAFSQESVKLLYNSRNFQIYHIIEDHFDMVHFEGTMDTMSSLFLFTALEYTETKYLSMNSVGGYMQESYILGSFLKSNPQITFVVRNDNVCMSACAFAALSSNKLMIGKNGLDFHTPYIPYVESSETLSNFSVESQVSLLELMIYLNESGYGIDLLDLLLKETDSRTFATFYTTDDLYHLKVENFFDRIDSTFNYEITTR